MSCLLCKENDHCQDADTFASAYCNGAANIESEGPASAIVKMQEAGKEPIQRLEQVAKAYVKDLSFTVMPPTRRCLLCGTIENEEASTINEAAAWLCTECRGKLLNIMGKEGAE